MRFFAVILALVVPLPSMAERVVVRAGEHVDFSRLVLMFDGTDGWDLGKVDGGYEFRAVRRDLQFDLARIYRFIPRDRIGAVSSPRPGVLFLAVSCECHADGFDLRRGRVVIDIKDGPATRQSRFDRTLPALAAMKAVNVPQGGANLDGEMNVGGASTDQVRQKVPVVPVDASPGHAGVIEINPSETGTEAPAGKTGIPPQLHAAAEGERVNAARSQEVGGASTPVPVAQTPEFRPKDLPDSHAFSAANMTFDIGASERARAFETMIIEQIARAGSQGLIITKRAFDQEKKGYASSGQGADESDLGNVAKIEDHAKREGSVRTNAEHPSQDHSQTNHSPESARSGRMPAGLASDHVRIETAIDRDKLNAPPVPLADDGGKCLPDTRLDIASWGTMAGGRPDIAAYRDDLTDALDRIQPDKALRLAKFFVYLTFGAEALQELNYARQDNPDREIVESLAKIMDRDAPSRASGIFSGLESCPTAAALWALLSDPELRPEQPVDADAAIRAFTALPEHLKRHLGPRLVDTFRVGGRLEAAEIVRNGMALSGKGGEVGVEVSTARLDAALGHESQAESRIRTVLSDTDPDSPEALLALAETRIDSKEKVGDDLLSALEAIVFDMQGTDVGKRVQMAIAEAHLTRDEFRPARDIALESKDLQDDAEVRDLLRRVYMAAASRADAETFLRLTLPAPIGLGRDTRDQSARLAIAERLQSLGFDEDALGVLGPIDENSPIDGRLIAARAELGLERPGQAIALVNRLGRDLAAPILAHAYEAQGKFEIARAYYRQAADDAGVARVSLMMDDWSRFPAPSDSDLGPAVEQLAQPSAAEPSGSIGPRAHASDLIAASQAERAAFESLLSGK